MKSKRFPAMRPLALAIAASLSAGAIADAAQAQANRPSPYGRPTAKVAQLPQGTQRPTSEVLLSVGEGQLVNLPANVTDVWTSNPGAADVYVNNRRQIYVYGKEFGEATIFATGAGGTVVYATNVRVSQNITSVERIVKLAMPEADIKVTTAGQLAILTGTVASPNDAEQAEQLVKAYLNPGVDVTQPGGGLKIGVFNRLRVATPLQVNLHVRIAEVSRSLSKDIGVNLTTLDTTGGFQFGITQGRPGGVTLNPGGGGTFVGREGATTFGAFGNLLGLDIGSALDLAENQGLVTTLAQPNLTALSGETASFLAGGEFPILVSQDEGSVTVEYKQYGVSLAFTPTVLADGRISMRVRPEVSELSTEGAIRLNGFDVSGITTRRAETTVELGSGQAFMIGGLLRNSQSNTIERAPGLGNIPILGALFRSSRFRKSESELVIVVTPYLVKPVSANQIALPTDGFRSATDAERVFLGRIESGKSDVKEPAPVMAPPTTVTTPAVGASLLPPAKQGSKQKRRGASAAPGFSGL